MKSAHRLHSIAASVLIFVIITICSHVPLLAQTWVGSGDGVSWGDAANWSTNTVPTSSDNAVISNASVSVSDQYIVQSVSLEDASLTIDLQSGLRLKGATTTALNLAGSSAINIDGLLRIDDFQSTGIRTLGNSSVDVRTTGILRIDSDGITGVKIESGTFNNSGDVSIKNVYVGMHSDGLITNGGTLLIENVQSFGIDHSTGGLKNCSLGRITIIGDVTSSERVVGIDTYGDLTNEGTIEVISCYEAAFRINQGTLINKDSLIFNDYSTGIFGGLSSGPSVIQNESTGLLWFETSSTNHITVSISTYGTFNNHGLIKMLDRTDEGIHMSRGFMASSETATATFNNYGLIECSAQAAGIFIYNEAIFNNHLTGEITISSIGDPDIAIFTNASFTNDGQIHIEWPGSSESCIASSSSVGPSYFTNHGQITTLGGSIGIQMNGSSTGGRSVLVNGETGILNIRLAGRGINLGDTLINKNIIVIDNCTSIGIVVVGNLTENSFLENRDSISILNTRRSIMIAGEFENSKHLNVHNGRDEGLTLDYNGIFKNTSSAFSFIESDIPIYVDSIGSVLEVQGEFVLGTPD